MKLIKTTIEGISYCENKNGITYYGSFRHPHTKKSTRKKLLNKERYLKKYDKEAYNILQALINNLKEKSNSSIVMEEKKKEIKNYSSLNELADLFFKDKYIKKEIDLKHKFPQYNNENFLNYSFIKNQIKNSKKNEITYNCNVRNYDIGKTPVNQITEEILEKYILIDINKRKPSQKYKFNIISLISNIWNHSIRKKRINVINPFVNLDEDLKVKNPKRMRARVLTPEEIRTLLLRLKEEKNKNYYYAVYLAVLTGARANSILNIKLKDIDTKNRFITIDNYKGKKKYKVSINEKAAKWLDRMNYGDEFEKDDYIIRRYEKKFRKKEPLSRMPEKIYEIMDELFNQGIDKSDNLSRDNICNFHTIRRSIATNLARNGTPIYNVMTFLNHSSVEQTMKYLNFTPEDLNNDIDSLMDKIFVDFNQELDKFLMELPF